jgi:hypothetical protein
MKLRIRRQFNTVFFEADSGSGFTLVRSAELAHLPETLRVGVASLLPIGAWPVTMRAES